MSDWTKRDDRLTLALTPERAVRVLGRSLDEILARRKVLAAGDFIWTAEHDQVVRALHPTAAALKLRIAVAVVLARRNLLGLPNERFAKMGRYLKSAFWTAEADRIVAESSAGEAARQLGVSKSAVYQRRKRAGLTKRRK